MRIEGLRALGRAFFACLKLADAHHCLAEVHRLLEEACSVIRRVVGVSGLEDAAQTASDDHVGLLGSAWRAQVERFIGLLGLTRLCLGVQECAPALHVFTDLAELVLAKNKTV